MDFRKNLKLRIKGVINIMAISLFLVLGLSLLQPFLYKSSFSVLIVQDAKDANDVYTAIKSADKLGSLLQKIVTTTDFFDAVMETKTYKVSKDDFSIIEKTKRKQWDRMIDVGLIQETGILEFDVYYKDKEGAEEYAKAIAETLINRSSKFYGASDIISIRVINAPLTSDTIEKPKIFINISLGLMFGLFASMLYIYFTIESKDDNDSNKNVSSINGNESLEINEKKDENKTEDVLDSTTDEQNFVMIDNGTSLNESIDEAFVESNQDFDDSVNYDNNLDILTKNK